MDDTAKATEALKESVSSILGCDEDDEVKRAALVETFGQFESYLDRNVAGKRERREKFEKIFRVGKADDGDDYEIAKRERGSGHHDLAASLVDQLSDALERRREAYGYQKSAEEQPMDTQTELIGIMKDCGGPVALCKSIVSRQRSPVGEHELVAALTKYAAEQHPELSPAQAFAKLYAEESVWRACAIAKAAAFDVVPVVVSGERARGGDVNPSDPSAAMEAYNELLAKAAEYRKANPALSEAQAFSAVFTARENAELAQRAHQRPAASSIFPMPR